MNIFKYEITDKATIIKFYNINVRTTQNPDALEQSVNVIGSFMFTTRLPDKISIGLQAEMKIGEPF